MSVQKLLKLADRFQKKLGQQKMGPADPSGQSATGLQSPADKFKAQPKAPDQKLMADFKAVVPSLTPEQFAKLQKIFNDYAAGAGKAGPAVAKPDAPGTMIPGGAPKRS